MDQLTIQCVTLLEEKPPKAKSWFDGALEALKVKESPAWPDKFGSSLRSWLKGQNHKPINTLSLFTGAGGLDIGFHDLGFESELMVEIEEDYCKTLNENSRPGKHLEKSKPVCMDIREFHPGDELKVDFIIGGPPCQTFSAAGRRAAGVLGTTDPRGMLFQEYVRLLKKLKPKGFLFENVYGITGAQNGEAWRSIQEGFKSAGYNIFFRILDTADYGVPQHRERLIIVGLREGEGEFLFPDPTHGLDSSDNRPFHSAGQAVLGVKTTEKLKSINGKFGYLLNDIPPGLNYSFYTERMGHSNPIFGWRSKFSDFLYKADPEKPVRVIKAQGGQYTGPFSWENRAFTIAELKRLQTMPDDYELVGGRQVCIEQIGNSVPTQMARILALSILDQVFKVNLPFKIKYMPVGKVLSFRTYKRMLSDEYEKKAKLAILNSTVTKKIQFTDESIIRYLSPNFIWEAKDIQNSKKVYVKHDSSSEEWTVSVNKNPDFNENYKYSITITPASGKWSLRFKRVKLYVYTSDEYLFTAAWKAFEEKLTEVAHAADLVQYSGYYQYRSNLSSVLEFRGETKSDPFSEIIRYVVSGSGVGEQLPEHQLALHFSVSLEELHSNLRKLREMGYEVRNHNTNPQIPKEHYLIPYSFPTLNHRSVQLRKTL